MVDLGHGPLIMGITWAFTAVAIAAVGMRFYLRVKLLNLVGLDDWIMLIALAFQITNSAMTTVAFHYGLGMHDIDMTFNQLVNVLKWVWLQTIPGVMVSILARISIVILLVRIFGKRAWFKWFLYATCIAQTCLAISLIPVMMSQCTPVQGLWNPTIGAVCWNPDIQQNLGYAVQSLFSFSDLTYVIIPCIFVYKLNMSNRNRLGLILVLCLGLFTFAASIVKVTVVSSSSAAADSQYRASISLLWAVLEQLLVIIMGCIPTLRTVAKLEFPPYIKSFMSSISSLVSNKSRKSSGAYDSDYGTREPSRSGEGGQTEKKEPLPTTYQVSSVHEQPSKPGSLEDGQIHKTVDYTVDRDGASVS